MPKCVGTVGAVVKFCGHEGCFAADILIVKNAAVVHAGGPVHPDNIARFGELGEPTHHIVDFPVAGFWKPRIGLFVVPVSQVRVLP